MADPLEKYRRKTQQVPHAAGPAPVRKLAQYKAYSPATQEKKYLVVRPKFPGPSEAYSYGQVTELNGDERYGTGVTIVFGTQRVIGIEGRNLHELFGLLKDWKVEFICEFDPEEFTEPDAPNQPVITSITIHTKPVEDPPPLEKRH